MHSRIKEAGAALKLGPLLPSRVYQGSSLRVPCLYTYGIIMSYQETGQGPAQMHACVSSRSTKNRYLRSVYGVSRGRSSHGVHSARLAVMGVIHYLTLTAAAVAADRHSAWFSYKESRSLRYDEKRFQMPNDWRASRIQVYVGVSGGEVASSETASRGLCAR